ARGCRRGDWRRRGRRPRRARRGRRLEPRARARARPPHARCPEGKVPLTKDADRPPSPRSMTDPITCVVADDHPAMLSAVAEILERSGFAVVGRARDGGEALALIESERPDIAVVDVRMPRLSGIEVASQAATTAPDTSIVF